MLNIDACHFSSGTRSINIMEREQRFNLAISLQNLKQNKLFIVLVLGVFSLIGLYLGYPLLVVKNTPTLKNGDYNFLNELFNPPLNVSKETLIDLQSPAKETVKWGFDSVTPAACTEDHVVGLGVGIYTSVCNYKGNIVIDIRKYTGNSKVGITPTIVGIGLNLEQWEVLVSIISIINQYVNDLS